MAADGPATTRRQARERALSLLYEAEAKGAPAHEVLEELPLEPAPFASQVVLGVSEHRQELDDLISRYSRNWPLERMPAIDRTLLRMGVFELKYRPDVPVAVAISEAVELAQRYSTDESGRFVNGMLARIAEELHRPA